MKNKSGVMVGFLHMIHEFPGATKKNSFFHSNVIELKMITANLLT